MAREFKSSKFRKFLMPISAGIGVGLVVGLLVPTSGQELATINVTCSLDNVSGSIKSENTYSAANGGMLIFQGWVADKLLGNEPQSVTILLIDKTNRVSSASKTQPISTSRPDVAEAFGVQTMKNSGFNIEYTPVLVPGDYKVLLKTISDGQPQYCQTQGILTITK